ncbi:MAG: hypothetical protein ABMB14_01250 [Myxococcota bacterium]
MADEVYVGSPLTALAAALGSGTGSGPATGFLPAGGVGAVIARSGVGKTPLIVHLGLEVLLRGKQILHVSIRDSVDHARAHYDEVLRAIGDRSRIGDGALKIERGRMIHSFHGRPFDVAPIERNLAMLAESAQFAPEVVLVDGFDGLASAAAALPALRDLAVRRGLRIWLSARLSGGTDDLADDLPGVDRVIRLVPSNASGRPLSMRLVVSPPTDANPTATTALDAVKLDAVKLDAAKLDAVMLDPVTLLVVDEAALRTDAVGGLVPAGQRVKARECTLYSGGAIGTEAAFGAAAERWGAHEVNFTFDGHLQTRTRGRYELSPKELAVGDVSLAYVSKRLSREYNDRGGLIRGVLQTLWHMVSRSQQVFVIGRIQDDGTVVGGTGWSVELARMWNRDLWVYDQEKSGWYRWDGVGWSAATPLITAMHVCGTGTRYLEPPGKAAIDDLFARSFGD